MPATIDHHGPPARPRVRRRRRHGGPAVLVTFAGAPFDARAARLAVESAADMRATLYVLDLVDVRPGRYAAAAALDPVPPAQAAALRAIDAMAAEHGVTVESLALPSARPVAALLAFVAERRPALLVFGTDPAALHRFRRPTRRRYRRFLAALERDAACLLWSAREPVAGPVPSTGTAAPGRWIATDRGSRQEPWRGPPRPGSQRSPSSSPSTDGPSIQPSRH